VSDLGYTAAFIGARLDEDKAEIGPSLSATYRCEELNGVHLDRDRALRGIEAKRHAVAACTKAAEADPNSPAGVLALAVLEAMSTEWEHPQRPFVPDWTLRPGVLLREALEVQGKSADDLLGGKRIIDGTLRIGPFEAENIASLLGTSADMWLNAQRIHDAALLRGATDTSEDSEHD
jgi:plasmid maintenance system antidote protein VapI